MSSQYKGSKKLYPNTTQYPNWIMDKVMAYLTGPEFKVLSYIVRRTYGFRKDADAIALSQLSSGNGKVDENGELVEGGTGLSSETIRKALKVLAEETHIIIRDASRQGKEHIFSINLDEKTCNLQPLVQRYEQRTDRYSDRRPPPLPSNHPPWMPSNDPPWMASNPQKLSRNLEETKRGEEDTNVSSSSRSAGLIYCLNQFSRKRFSTKGQEETLAALEREVGTETFKWAVDWLANFGKLNANALCTAARKKAKEKRREEVQRQRTPPTKSFVPKERTPWDDVLDILRGQMTREDFAQMWEGTDAELTDDGIIVFAKTDRHRDWIDNRLRRILEQATHKVWPGQPVTIKTKGE